MKNGRSRLASAAAMHHSAAPAGVLNANRARAFQYSSARLRASRVMAFSSVPVTTTAALQRGSSAQAYPIHTAASMIPAHAAIAGSPP